MEQKKERERKREIIYCYVAKFATTNIESFEDARKLYNERVVTNKLVFSRCFCRACFNPI